MSTFRKQAEKIKEEILNDLRDQNNTLPAKVIEAKKIISEFEKENLHRKQKIFNAKLPLPLPSGDVCPYCFVESGAAVHMVAISASIDAPNINIYECKTCSSVIEVE
jgi:hypothetical protein